MAEIWVPAELDNANFKVLSTKWESVQNASIVLPLSFSQEEIVSFVKFLVSKLPNDLASAVLSEVLERTEISITLLESIFELCDTASQVAICIRSDISATLLNKCLSSESSDVLEHIIFNKAVSICDCEKLLTTMPGKKSEYAVKRAIEYKKSQPA